MICQDFFPCLELHEFVEHLIFGFNQVDPNLSQKVVDEGDKEFGTIVW